MSYLDARPDVHDADTTLVGAILGQFSGLAALAAVQSKNMFKKKVRIDCGPLCIVSGQRYARILALINEGII